MTLQVPHPAPRPAARMLALLWLLFALPAAATDPVPLTDLVHEYGADSALAPLDQTFQIALIDAGWLPLTVAEREIMAETTIRGHYAKVRIRFGDGKATFTLMEGKNLDQRECKYTKDRKVFRGPCIHPAYYEWLERIAATLPVARAKVVLMQSLVGNGRKP